MEPSAMRESLVSLREVRFSYDGGTSWVLDGVSLDIRRGEYVCLAGANGSGKSTLARLIAGLVAPDAGRIMLCGETVFDGEDGGSRADAYRTARRHIGAVFQNPGDQIITTIADQDVAFGPENLAVPSERIGERVETTLEAVGMFEARHDDPTRMSGGQQQRIAIAGMLAMRPDLMVLDEPTAMLDPSARGEVLRVLDTLHASGTTIVHVTHDVDELARAERVLRLEDGRVVAEDDRSGVPLSGGAGRCFDSGLRPPLSMTEKNAPRIASNTTGKGDAPHAPLSMSEKNASHTSVSMTGGDAPHAPLDTTESYVGQYAQRRPFLCHAERSVWRILSCHAERNMWRIPFCHAERSAQRGVEASSYGANVSRPPAIHVENLRFAYPGSDSPTLDGVSFDIAAGETVALMGSNGAGKSTLIRLLAALEQPQSGVIEIAGLCVAAAGDANRRARKQSTEPHVYNLDNPSENQRANWHGSTDADNHADSNADQSAKRYRRIRLSRSDRKALRRTLGLVMQHPERQLFANTVRDDVAYGPRNLGLSKAETTARVDDALNLLGITRLADQSPFHLSGGQQRLAAIAGVIACHPQVLVLDEPMAGLDGTARDRICAMLGELKARGVTVLLVTHSPDDARALADRVLIMDHGRIVDESSGRTNGKSRTMSDVDRSCTTTGGNGRTMADGNSRMTTEDAAAVRESATAGQSTTGEAPATVRNLTMTRSSVTDGHTATTQNSATIRIPVMDGRSATDESSIMGKVPVTDGDSTTSRDSFVHRLDPRVKMVSFLALMFSAFVIDSWPQLALGGLATLALVATARLNPLRLLASTRALLAMLFLFGLLNLLVVRGGTTLLAWGPVTITDRGAQTAVIYAARLALVVILGAIFLSTTTPTAIADACSSLLSPLRRLGVHTQELALVLSLALRFVPTLTLETRAVLDAQAARGGSVETGSPMRRARALGAIVVPVLAGALRHAERLGLALDARCYEAGVERTRWHPLAVRARDWSFLTLTVGYLAALVAIGVV